MIGNMPGHIFDLKTQACVHCGLSQYGVAEFPKLQVCIKQMGDDMPTPQEDFWRGEFGNSYTSRNRLDWSRRVPFFEDMIMWTGARSVLEIGCNAAWNMRALNAIDPSLELTGIDVNSGALQEAVQAGYDVYECPAVDVGRLLPAHADLAMTVGVLIHIPTEQLSAVMDSIIAASRQYVLAVEYASDVDEEVTYRGHAERLWRRPFGNLYQDKGLKLIETGEAGEGFDRCHYWLMEKT